MVGPQGAASQLRWLVLARPAPPGFSTAHRRRLDLTARKASMGGNSGGARTGPGAARGRGEKAPEYLESGHRRSNYSHVATPAEPIRTGALAARTIALPGKSCGVAAPQGPMEIGALSMRESSRSLHPEHRPKKISIDNCVTKSRSEYPRERWKKEKLGKTHLETSQEPNADQEKVR